MPHAAMSTQISTSSCSHIGKTLRSVCAILIMAACGAEEPVAPTPMTPAVGPLTAAARTTASGVESASSVLVSCIATEADLRRAATDGGSYSFCTPRTSIRLSPGSAPVRVARSLYLTENGPLNSAVIGNGSRRVFDVDSRFLLQLTNITVTGGKDSLGGGVIVGPYAILELRGRTRIRGNTAAAGGGVYADAFSRVEMFNSAAVTLDTVRSVTGQAGWLRADGGGGIFLSYKASLTMYDTSAITENRSEASLQPGVVDASGGGGVVIAYGSSMTMHGYSLVSRNRVNGDRSGGGILIDSRDPYAENRLTIGPNARVILNSLGTTSVGQGGGVAVLPYAGRLPPTGTPPVIIGITKLSVLRNSPNNFCTGSVCAF
jgi:hypothetical protein